MYVKNGINSVCCGDLSLSLGEHVALIDFFEVI